MWLAFAAALVLALLATSAAWALGELSQKPGQDGCVGGKAEDGCGEGRALEGPLGVVVSPDGRNVYVASLESDAVAIFDRDPATGKLTQKPGAAGCISEVGGACEKGNGIDGPQDLAVSPDGRNVYVSSTGSDGVAIFDRDPTGRLAQRPGMDGCIAIRIADGCRPGRGLGRATSVAVSPDGTSVYVTGEFSSAVAIFDRDLEGKLTQKPEAAGCVSEDGTDHEGHACMEMRALGSARDAEVSPDGENVYVASEGSNAVAIFKREPGGGLNQAAGKEACLSLSGSENCQPGIGLEDARSVAVSRDGKGVLVGSEGALAILTRDQEGNLTQGPGLSACISSFTPVLPCQPARSVLPFALSVSPEGTSVYASSGAGGVAVLDRGPDGALTQKPGTAGCISPDGAEGCQSARALQAAFGIATSPDGRNVYIADSASGAVAIFDRATPPAPDTVAPQVSGFKLAPARFKAKRGSRFRLSLSEPASARIAIERARPGRRVGKRCKAPTPRLAHRRPCRRFTRAGALSLQALPAGPSRIRFTGRIGKRRLAPGPYRATILATDAAGNRSVPRRAGFRVLR